MKKVSALLFTFLFFLSLFGLFGCAGQSREPKDLLARIKFRNKIIVGIKNDSKPFGYVEDGELKGFDIDIAKSISKSLLGDDKGELIEFVVVTPESRISDLNSGYVDIVIATMSISAKRNHIIDFTNPYYVAGQALMVKEGSKINSIQSLNTRRAGIILGTTGEKTIRQLAPNATVVAKKNYNEAFNLLKEDRVDAILADDSILYGFIMNNEGYKILPARYTKEFYAIALRQGEENKELKDALNKILNNMQQTGKLNRIKEKWIPNLHKGA
ncbi:MAG: transporter substrate-binding domain-containing protein [Candidatus Gastranaerophilales bacterium]|nr:transporter substrate-binding domain-containing protein [Candidatus Gastranaerophilales bacterium]